MSVYKERVMMLEDVINSQGVVSKVYATNAAFRGPFGDARGFNLKCLTPHQQDQVNNLREFCQEFKDYATIKKGAGVWKFTFIMDEGSYGWKVSVTKIGDFLGVSMESLVAGKYKKKSFLGF
jgi:hypothetical protein